MDKSPGKGWFRVQGSRFSVQGSGFRVQACPSAKKCGYEIVFTFYGLSFPSPHLDMPGLGQGFKGYNQWTLLTKMNIEN